MAQHLPVVGGREGALWTAYYHDGAGYSMAMAGVHGFIRSVALELAEYNITANVRWTRAHRR